MEASGPPKREILRVKSPARKLQLLIYDGRVKQRTRVLPINYLGFYYLYVPFSGRELQLN